MRRFFVISFSLLLFPALGSAQEFQQPRGVGYAFVAPGLASASGERTNTFQFGGGGEGRIYKGLGAGAELGYLFPGKRFQDGFGLFSANGFYHFPSLIPSGKLIPFATGGYSGGFTREWGENWFNFGGGVDYWFHQNVGLRLEVRDNVDPNHSQPLHLVGFRVGVIF